MVGRVAGVVSRAQADAEAREIGRRLIAEADVKLHQPDKPDEMWLGRWIGQAWATLQQLCQEPE